MKSLYQLVLSFLSLVSFSAFAQIVGANAYMIGDFVEVGIDARGYEGAPMLGGSHARGGVGLGFVANPAMDGWVQYDGDFFLPGSPENGFGIEVAGTNYGNNRVGLYQIPGSISSYDVTGDCIKVQWSGAAAGVAVDITYSMITTNLFYNTQVILTNTTGATLTDVYYYRNFDPDNNQSIGGGFSTTNTIEAQPSPACEKALVSATQTAPHPSYVGIGAIGPDYRVTYGGFANRDASNIWNGTGFTSAVGSTGTGDVAISMAHRTYTLAPGESDTIQFTIILNSSDIDAAISSLYFFDYSGATGIIDECSPVVDTAWTCAGQPETISIDGPGVANFTWSWSPGTALSSTTGSSVDASPSTTTLYTVTGTPIAACVSTTISKEIVVDIYPAPDLVITDPGPQCGDFDLTTLAYTDLNAIPGTTIEFYSLIPDSATQTVGIWPSTTIGPGDVVYMMMANPASGCFDVEPVIIDFSGGAVAGPDNTTTLCNTPGSTVDVNTLLTGADPGGFWEEISAVPSGGFTPGTGIFNADGVAGGTYYVHYVATAIAPCTNDTAVMTITVNPAPNSGLDNVASLCNSAGTTLDLNTLLSGADAGGTWAETTGTPTGGFTAGTGILNASGVTGGTYTFEYTTAGVAPCTNDVAVMSITIEQEVTAGSDNSSSLCNSAGTTLDLNTLLIGADAGGTWSETTGGVPSGGFTSATGILDASGVPAGVYTFDYTVAAVAPCVDDAATFTITIQNEVTAGLDNTDELCNSSGTTLDLNTLLTGADAGGSWSETTLTPTGSFTPGSGILDASGVPAGVYTFEYYVSAIAPCLDDQASITITIEQEVTAGTDNVSVLCNTAGSTLDMNTLLSGADTGGTWSETTGTPSGSFTPGTGNFDASGLTPGVYTFEYYVTAIAPCVDDLSEFTVTVTDLPDAGLDNSDELCNTSGTTLDLNTLLMGADAGGTWSETSVSASGGFTAATGILDASGVPAGVYTFDYTISPAGPCPGDVATMTITIQQAVNAGSDNTAQLCNYSGTTLNLNSLLSGADAGGTWSETSISPSGTFTSSSGVLDASGLIAGTYSFEYLVNAIAPCTNDIAEFTVTVDPEPIVNFTADNLIGCAPLQVTFSNLSTPAGDDCTWSFGDGTTAPGCGDVVKTYNNAGTYDVTLTVTTAAGCTNTDTYNSYITVSPVPEASFSPSSSVVTVDLPEVEFINNSLNADSYTWTFGDQSASTNEENPTHVYPSIGNQSYTVYLIAENSGGCIDSASVVIQVDDVLIFYIPNSFTPDGDDYNQTFKPVITSGVDIYDYHLTIFNRWGEIVFESYDVNYGWNGAYGDRGLTQSEVFIWQIEFGETMSDKKRTYRGHVTLMK